MGWTVSDEVDRLGGCGRKRSAATRLQKACNPLADLVGCTPPLDRNIAHANQLYDSR
jgi:hypothetical protein